MDIKNKLKFILLYAFVVFACTAYATDTEVKEFTVDGIKVILKPAKKEVISTRLFIEGGTANYPKSKEGIEALTLQLAIDGGTKSLEKTAFATELEKMGIHLGANTTYDYGNISMTCIKMFWDKSWDLFTDAIINPSFDEEEFNLLKEKLVASARQTMSNPDAHLRNLAMSNVFKEQNYSKIPEGTPESLQTLSLQDLKSYYSKILGKKRIFLVVVGDVTEADLRAKIQSTLAKLPEGQQPEYEQRKMLTVPGQFIENRDIATNYIRGILSAPTLDTQDGVPMQIAMSILYDRYFLELRTKRSLSYAPGAFYSNGVLKNPYNVVYISTTDPKQAMQVMVEEINNIRKNGFTEKEIKDKKLSFLTDHFMGLETTGSQSQSLGSAEIAGDWRIAEDFTEKVNNVKLEDLNRVFNKYSNIINWTYLGKENAVTQEDFIQPQQIPQNQKLQKK